MRIQRSKPTHITFPITEEGANQIDQMLDVLYQEQKKLTDLYNLLVAAGVGTGAKQGRPGFDGDEGDSGEMGPPGPRGSIGARGAMGPMGMMGDDGEEGERGWPGPAGSGSGGSGTYYEWSVLTNGDPTTPELIFAGGDVIMVRVP